MGVLDEFLIDNFQINNRLNFLSYSLQLQNQNRTKKAPPIELYRLVENGYMQSAIIFHITEHKYQRKFFEKEALNFAKCAEKFERILGSDFVKPEVWKSRQNTLAVKPSKVPDFMSSKMRFDQQYMVLSAKKLKSAFS